jgi:leader peptidase (prepilin peptidase)/N-methyltransferase
MTSQFLEISTAWPWFFPSAAFVLGACIGSFLNVVISRLPAGTSVVFPGSRCECGAAVPWRHNLPVVSWLWLRGRARCCGRRISARHLAVEVLTAAAFLACWLVFPPAKAACGMVFLSALVAATFIDLEHMVIPDSLTLGLGVAGVGLSFLVPALHEQRGGSYALDSILSGGAGIVGLLIGSGLVLWIALLAEAALKKEAMGFGDIKFAGAIGAFTGWPGAVFAVFGGAVVGCVWIALALVWNRLAGRGTKSLGLGARVPFGPMLAVAAAIYFLGGETWVAAYIDRLAVMF